MGVKEFFRLTKKKIVLIVIISIFLVFFFISTRFVHGIFQSPFYWLLYWPFLSLGLFLDSLIQNQGSLTSISRFILMAIIFAAELLYIYILSAIIIWVFNKARGK